MKGGRKGAERRWGQKKKHLRNQKMVERWLKLRDQGYSKGEADKLAGKDFNVGPKEVYRARKELGEPQ